MELRLVRSESERMIAGVCGGLAQYLGVDPVLVRLAFLLLVLAGSIGVPLYFILMIIMPNESDANLSSPHTVEKNVGGLDDSTFSNMDRSGQHPNGPAIAAGLLIVMGVYFLLQNFNVVSSNMLWPLALILAGSLLLIRRNA